MRVLNNRYTKISLSDWLLIISLVLAPMTGLRIAQIGPAEVLVFFWCIVNHRYILKLDRIFFYFWMFFTSVIFVGSIIGTLLFPSESNMAGIITWVYFAVISLSGCSILKNFSFVRLKRILKIMAVSSAIWYLFLYIYSIFVSSYFAGAPLWFEETRFSGGGNNPHQVALLLGCIVVLLFFFVLKEQKKSVRGCYLLILFISFFLLLETESSTGLMATIVGIVYLIYENFFALINSGLQLKLIFWIACGCLGLLFNQYILDAGYQWISSDENGIGRLEIFSSIGVAFWKSPLFGLGPGIHGANGAIEFHNTYLEIIAMGGIIGFFVFLMFTIKIYSRIKNTPLSVAIMLTLYVFGLAGFGMRRLVFWIFLFTIYIFSQKDLCEKEQNILKEGPAD
ncbi:MAG: O-antigen ligase family protein [Clostridia bacterium]